MYLHKSQMMSHFIRKKIYLVYHTMFAVRQINKENIDYCRSRSPWWSWSLNFDVLHVTLFSLPINKMSISSTYLVVNVGELTDAEEDLMKIQLLQSFDSRRAGTDTHIMEFSFAVLNSHPTTALHAFVRESKSQFAVPMLYCNCFVLQIAYVLNGDDFGSVV